MLFIDGVQVTAEEVSQRFNVPLEKIRKAPEFVINPERLVSKKSGQSKEMNIPAGKGVMASMFIKEGGKKLQLRYAEAVNQVEKGNKYVDEYAPRKIHFKGLGVVIRDDNEDLMVYMYLHPACAQSPFRSKNSPEKPGWAFKDLEREGEEVMEGVIALNDALQAILSYSGEPLRIIAKGFGIQGVDKQTDKQVQAELSKKAQNPMIGGPVAFLEKINTNDTIFRGLINNGIDRNLFIVKTSGGRKRWTWGASERRGMDIVDLYDNGTPDGQVLIEYILTKISEYYPILMKYQESYVAEKTANDFWAGKDLIDLNKMFSPAFKEQAPIGGGTDETSSEDDIESLQLDKMDLGTDDIDDDFPEKLDIGEETQVPGFLQNLPPAPSRPTQKKSGK